MEAKPHVFVRSENVKEIYVCATPGNMFVVYRFSSGDGEFYTEVYISLKVTIGVGKKSYTLLAIVAIYVENCNSCWRKPSILAMLFSAGCFFNRKMSLSVANHKFFQNNSGN